MIYELGSGRLCISSPVCDAFYWMFQKMSHVSALTCKNLLHTTRCSKTIQASVAADILNFHSGNDHSVPLLCPS